MEQNYTEQLRQYSFNEDALLMQQVIIDDYDLLVIDLMLDNAFSSKSLTTN